MIPRRGGGGPRRGTSGPVRANRGDLGGRISIGGSLRIAGCG